MRDRNRQLACLGGLLAAVTCSLVGCRAAQQIRSPAYAHLVTDLSAGNGWHGAAEAMPPMGQHVADAQTVDQYVQLGLAQNPRIQAARMRVEAMANRVPQAASLPDPMLGVNIYAEPVQTAAGEQQVSLMASQKIPWNGKLAARAAVAEQETNMARAELAAVELEVIEQIRRAYYQLYFIQHSIEITERDALRLDAIERLVNQMYASAERKISQQDVLNVQVERSKLETQLVSLRQQRESAQARLALLIHVSPETPLRAANALPEQQVQQDLQLLYQQAIEARPDLHAQLASICRDRRSADLARLEYYPDVTVGLTWIETADAGLSHVANGRDALLLNFNVNLPVYRKRLDAAVREAEARAVASAREYEALKDQAINDVKDLFAQVVSQQELLQIFREEIIDRADSALSQSISAYEVGEVDFLQMIDNWRDLLRYQIAEKQVESQLHQSLASLARAVGDFQLRDAVPVEEGIFRIPANDLDPAK